jgi:hypothetical protein
MGVKEVWNYHKGRYVTYLVRTQCSGSKPQGQVPLPYYWMTHEAATIFVARQHSANLPLCYAGIPSSVASLSILLLPPMIYLPPVTTYKTNIDVTHTHTHIHIQCMQIYVGESQIIHNVLFKIYATENSNRKRVRKSSS